MKSPFLIWVAVIAPIAWLAFMIGLFAHARRYERRRRARLKEEVARKLFSAFGPLDDRQLELLRHGVLPWYEFPGPRSGNLPTGRSNAGGDEPRPGDGEV